MKMMSVAHLVCLVAVLVIQPGAHADVVYDSTSLYGVSSLWLDTAGTTVTLDGNARYLTSFQAVYWPANLIGNDDFLRLRLTATDDTVFFESRWYPIDGSAQILTLDTSELYSPENPIPLAGPVPDTFGWSLQAVGQLWWIVPEGAVAPEVVTLPFSMPPTVGSGAPYLWGGPDGTSPLYLPVRFEATIVPEPSALMLFIMGILTLIQIRRT